MAGSTQPHGMPSYADFVAGVAGALDHVRANHYGQHVLMVTSGGPIATAVGHVLGTRPEVTIDLNLRIRNTAITEFAFTPKRHMLAGFNATPAPGCAGVPRLGHLHLRQRSPARKGKIAIRKAGPVPSLRQDRRWRARLRKDRRQCMTDSRGDGPPLRWWPPPACGWPPRATPPCGANCRAWACCRRAAARC